MVENMIEKMVEKKILSDLRFFGFQRIGILKRMPCSFFGDLLPTITCFKIRSRDNPL